MKKKIIAGFLCFTLMLSVLLSLSGCTTARAEDLMEGVTADPVNTNVDLAGDDSAAIAAFSVSLLQKSKPSDENTLLSPISVLCAMAMTANGAKGDTLTQLENAFGLPVAELNSYLHAYLNSLPSGDKYQVDIANSIWLKNDKSLTVEPDFLQTNADYYGASVYQAPFNHATVKDINTWVRDCTDGMIENIIDQIPSSAMMYLVNALSFDAEWECVYKENDVEDGTFTTQSGETRNVKMMYAEEGRYLEDGSATGFLKYYADRKYAFAALLPNEGISMDDYVASLTGAGLMNTLNEAQETEVETAIPKFESEYSIEMNDILKSMGVKDAFDQNTADFSGIGKSGSGKLFISQVFHKTGISVNEKGTKAGAATAVYYACAALEDTKVVHLNRPFVYMLIDCETNLPIFIGTMMDIGE